MAFIVIRKSSICWVWTFWWLRRFTSAFFFPHNRTANKHIRSRAKKSEILFRILVNRVWLQRTYQYKHLNIKSYFYHLFSSCLFRPFFFSSSLHFAFRQKCIYVITKKKKCECEIRKICFLFRGCMTLTRKWRRKIWEEIAQKREEEEEEEGEGKRKCENRIQSNNKCSGARTTNLF